jgi:hypothetical protein
VTTREPSPAITFPILDGPPEPGHPAHPVTSGHRSRHSGFARSISATQALAALAPKLTANQPRQAVPPVLGAIQGTTDPDVLEALGQGLAALAPKLTSEQARPAVAPVLAAMEHNTAPAALETLGHALAALAPPSARGSPRLH